MVPKPEVVGTLPHQSSRHARLFPILLLIAAALLFGAATFYHYVIYLPQPKQPHRLTIVDDFFALGVVIVVIIVGLALGRRLLWAFHVQGLTRLERSILALGLGWGLLSLSVLIVGIAHLLFTWILVAGMVLIILFSWRDVWQMLITITTISWYAPLNAIRPRSLLERTLVLILAIQVVLACIQALTLPIYPRGWDLYSYHWAVPQEFLFHHAIYAVPGWASADFPINSEMLNVLALAVGSPIAALMIQMVFGIAMVLLIAGFLYRRYGSLAAWLGVILCMTSPLFIAYLTSGYVEPATAYYGVAALVIALLWIDFQREEVPQKWQLPLLAGIFSGLGVGAKYQAGMVVVGVVLLFAVAGGLSTTAALM